MAIYTVARTQILKMPSHNGNKAGGKSTPLFASPT